MRRLFILSVLVFCSCKKNVPEKTTESVVLTEEAVSTKLLNANFVYNDGWTTWRIAKLIGVENISEEQEKEMDLLLFDYRTNILELKNKVRLVTREVFKRLEAEGKIELSDSPFNDDGYGDLPGAIVFNGFDKGVFKRGYLLQDDHDEIVEAKSEVVRSSEEAMRKIGVILCSKP